MKSSKSWKALLIFPAAVALVAAWVGFLAYQGPALGQTAGAIQVIGPLTRDNGAIQTLTAASAGSNSADQSGFNVTRIICVLRVTAITGTSPTITFSIQNKDAASGQYYSIITSPSITTASTNFIAVGGDLANVANSTAAIPVARTWRTSTTIGGTTPAVTATLGCSLQ